MGKLFYAQDPEFDYSRDLGDPGCPPFTRGIYKDMYRGRNFTVRQLTGLGSPEDTNKRMKYLLSKGATGVSIVFDLPTIHMYDSDDPISEGHVGLGGVAIDSVEDMEVLFDGIAIDKLSVSLVTHYPSNTAILLAMYLAVVQKRGIPWTTLMGTVQNDATMESVVSYGAGSIPPEVCFKLQCDNVWFIRENMPRWNAITYNGYNLRESGTDGITEVAVALSNAIETLNTLGAFQWVAERMAFFWCIGNNFFEEVARIRAVRRLWYKIMRDRFAAIDQKSMVMRCHAQTSGLSLSRIEPLNNIVRASYQAMAAVLGGVQSLHVDSYDEAYAPPTEETALVSLRTQQIIQDETGITEVADPLGGSFYVEMLTNEMEKRIVEKLNRIEELGGYVKMIKGTWLRDEINEYVCSQGHERHSSQKSFHSTECSMISGTVEKRQIDKLDKLKGRRDDTKVKWSLDQLRQACAFNGVILPYVIGCAKSLCTEGEISKVMRECFNGSRSL